MKSVVNENKRRPKDSASGQDQKQFVSPRQLAERWACTSTTAQRIAQRAGIAKYCLGEGRNGMVRYLLSDVRAYEERRRIDAVV